MTAINELLDNIVSLHIINTLDTFEKIVYRTIPISNALQTISGKLQEELKDITFKKHLNDINILLHSLDSLKRIVNNKRWFIENGILSNENINDLTNVLESDGFKIAYANLLSFYTMFKSERKDTQDN